LTFVRFEARMKYWHKFPPPHVMLRAIAIKQGAYKPEPDAAPRGKVEDLRSLFPGGQIK
jgi:hypothetical protein